MYRVIGWAAEVDFATMANARNIIGNPPGFPSNVQGPPGQGPLVVSPSITDMFVTITEMPIGNFRVGNFKEPIGLEHLTSSRWLDFMERSYNQDAFYGPFNNGFSPGMMLFDFTTDCARLGAVVRSQQYESLRLPHWQRVRRHGTGYVLAVLRRSLARPVLGTPWHVRQHSSAGSKPGLDPCPRRHSQRSTEHG